MISDVLPYLSIEDRFCWDERVGEVDGFWLRRGNPRRMCPVGYPILKVLILRSPEEIIQPVVEVVAIPMATFQSFWPWADEGFHDQQVDSCPARLPPGSLQHHIEVALTFPVSRTTRPGLEDTHRPALPAPDTP
jgi:hypothetical protein